MKAILQRVHSASVAVDGITISKIGKGLLVLVGISRYDTDKDMEYIIRKILNLRLWDDDKGKRWAHSLSSQKLEVLCVSQFTLYHVLKGNVPDFHNAMNQEESKPFFDKFIEQLKSNYSPDLVQSSAGKFGHLMEVNMSGHGPVTITLDSSPQAPGAQQPQQKPTKKTTSKSQQESSATEVEDFTVELPDKS